MKNYNDLQQEELNIELKIDELKIKQKDLVSEKKELIYRFIEHIKKEGKEFGLKIKSGFNLEQEHKKITIYYE